MDKAQIFIKECLFTKNFENPNKPIDENRLQETLLLMPTDGGLSSRLKRNKSKLKINTENVGLSRVKTEHPHYRTINKNSKITLSKYINDSKKASRKAEVIAKEKNIHDKDELYTYLEEHNKLVFDNLPKYEKFLPMYEEFWLGYIKDLLNIPSNLKVGTKLSINGSTSLVKLSMADYNGSLLRVAKSKNRNLVGIEGIVIWDSQKSFIMVTKGVCVNKLKCIPKKGTVFEFEIPINEEDALQYSILGDRFKYRSVDRANRKFKSRRCDDMLYYMINE